MTRCIGLLLLFCQVWPLVGAERRPHIIFVMADDMGWGQTGYRKHPVLKTPNLDAMASHGLRFERFYAGGPVCSPTRASVLTGRSPDRTGVLSHGYALRPQEKTVSQALKNAGYVTGHFGKWHLNGIRGPGAPVLATDRRHPGRFGFDSWVSVSNFFDLNPLMSRDGKVEAFDGDSSEITVAEAVRFLEEHASGSAPMFLVLWFGSPHSPFRALASDADAFEDLPSASANHYGELVAMDRSIGTLRAKLRELGIATQTMLVFCSDNGGLPRIRPETVGGLRGHKGSVYEGGLRVPGIIEWPDVIAAGRVTEFPACTMDLFPTVVDIVGLPPDAMLEPVDGISLKPLLLGETGKRQKPIPFRYQGRAALIDNRYKLVCLDLEEGDCQLFDLEQDPKESRNMSLEKRDIADRLKEQLLAWSQSVESSFGGKDYPEGDVRPRDPEPVFWSGHPAYQPYLEEWLRRPEYRSMRGRVRARQN